jgi:hypothetical protein
LRRRKEGEDPNASRNVRVSYERLEGLFHLPLTDAAQEIGLCPTTFKRACRRFDLEQWPFRQKQGWIRFARKASRTDGIDAIFSTLHQDSVRAPAAPTLQTTEVQQAMCAVTKSCTSPVWHDEAFSSAAPQGLLWQASMALDTRSDGEASDAGPAFDHFAPLQLKTFAPLGAPSYIDTLTRGCVVIGVPQPCLSPLWRDASPSDASPSSIASSSSSSELHWDRATPLETGPPREPPCVEAVMDYLDLGCPISPADVESMLSNDASF